MGMRGRSCRRTRMGDGDTVFSLATGRWSGTADVTINRRARRRSDGRRRRSRRDPGDRRCRHSRRPAIFKGKSDLHVADPARRYSLALIGARPLDRTPRSRCTPISSSPGGARSRSDFLDDARGEHRRGIDRRRDGARLLERRRGMVVGRVGRARIARARASGSARQSGARRRRTICEPSAIISSSATARAVRGMIVGAAVGRGDCPSSPGS